MSVKLTNSPLELALLGVRIEKAISKNPNITEVELRSCIAREAKRCGLVVTVEGNVHIAGGRHVMDGWGFALEELLS